MLVKSSLGHTFNSYSKDNLFHFFSLAIQHLLLLSVAVVVINKWFFGINLLNPNLAMDADWYWKIRQQGYSYTPGHQSSVAFYPLFALIWRWTDLGYWGICILNYFLLLASLFIITMEYQIRGAFLMVLLTVPSLIFSLVPYSESTFFIGSTILLFGFKRDSLPFIIIGTLISCLSRSASAILLIAFVLTNFICEYRPLKGHTLLKYLLAITTAFVTSIGVRYYQVFEVGRDFSMFEVQAQWNRHLSLPSFPLTTLSHVTLVWNDFLALFVAMICGGTILQLFFERVKKKVFDHPDVMLAFLYIAGVAIVTLSFSGTFGERGTSIHSLNRFIFCTPFFTIFLIQTLEKTLIKKRAVYWLALLFFLLYLSFIVGSKGEYATLWFQFKALGYFGLMALIPLLYVVTSHQKKITILPKMLYFFSIVLQAFLYCAHLGGFRVG